MQKETGYLILETGEVYTGIGYGIKKNSIGELVFNTSITGYQEVITDPSYKGQVVAFTYPHIGNVGICTEDKESNQTYVKAIITREIPMAPSSWRSSRSLKEYLTDNNITGLAEIDTRKLTKTIRDKGNLLGMIIRDNIVEYEDALEQIQMYKNNDLISKSLFSPLEKSYLILNNKKNTEYSTLNIVIIDYGCKNSILNMLKALDCNVLIYPYDCYFESIKKLRIDAVILSNGPGDPELYRSSINLIQEIINEEIPILGICLGHQLLGMALGAKIKKLQFGHHGINHPVQDLSNKKVYITSQNHNYALDKDTLPSILSITHISLFDNSIQGFKHNQKNLVGFQGHPEGGPGPTDIQKNIVEKFLLQIRNTRKNNLNI